MIAGVFLDYRTLTKLQEDHPTVRLLRAHTMPFIISFFWRQFTSRHQRILAEDDLVAALDDHRRQINEAEGEQDTAASSIAYLRGWVEAGYLRQYYIEQDDTPRYELTPATEKAVDWMHSLRSRSFIGTESRLRTIFDLLRNLREETEANIEARLAILTVEKQRLEAEMARVAAGDIKVLTPTQVREQFAQMDDLGRQLLRDFSEVEQNFRTLDRTIRAKIARLDGGRGAVLGAVFSESDAIAQSEQGRSFTAFFEFLMSMDRQDELEALLTYLYELPAIKDDQPDSFLARIQTSLLDASDHVMSTRHRLSAQLRRFLDERSRRENTRIMRLISALETELLEHKSRGDLPVPVALDELHAQINSGVRQLYRLPLEIARNETIDEADGRSLSADALFTLEQIDERLLLARIRRCLDSTSPVTLAEVLRRFPVEKGMGELVAYLKIASHDAKALIEPEDPFAVEISVRDQRRTITMPQVIFCR